MTRMQVLQQLAASKAELAARAGVTRLALFGSVVRDSVRADSDVDILVSFEGPATSARYSWSIVVTDVPALLPALRALRQASP
jgi:predicted nucleotidyltransferase